MVMTRWDEIWEIIRPARLASASGGPSRRMRIKVNVELPAREASLSEGTHVQGVSRLGGPGVSNAVKLPPLKSISLSRLMRLVIVTIALLFLF
jgi:hypothetical protein